MAVTITEIQAVLSLKDEFTGKMQQAMKYLPDLGKSFEAVAIGATAAAGVITAATAAIVMLGERGAEVSDVAEAFQQFSGSAQKAQDNLVAMREGSMGLVSDFELMKNATHLLSAGVQMNAKDFETLTAASFVLQNRGYGPTAEILEKLTHALITGRTRQVEYMLGVLDAKGAQADYSEELGLAGETLNKTAQVEAARQVIMQRLADTVKAAGAQHRDFAEQVEYVKTEVGNFTDSLGVAIANSPVVQAAMDGIGAALERAFGGNQVSMVDTLIGYVNTFVIGLTYAAQTGLVLAEGLNVVWSLIKTGVLAATTLVVGLGASFADIADRAVSLGAKLHLIDPATVASVKDFHAQLDGMTKSLQDQTGEAARGVVGQDGFAAAVGKGMAAVGALRGKMIQASAAGVDHNNVLNDLSKTHQQGGANAAAHEKQVAKLLETLTGGGQKLQVVVEAFRRLTDAQKGDADVQDNLLPILDKLIEQHQRLTPELKAYYEQALQTRLAVTNQGAELLRAKGITEQYIDTLKAQGLSETEIAHKLDVSVESLKQYVGQLDVARQVAHLEASARIDDLARVMAADNVVKDDTIANLSAYVTEYSTMRHTLDDLDLAGVEKAVRNADRQLEAEKGRIDKTVGLTAVEKQQLLAMGQELRDRQVALATGTSTDIAAITHSLGQKTSAELQADVDKARREYETLRTSGTASWQAIRAAYEEYRKALEARGGSGGLAASLLGDLDRVPQLMTQALTGGGGLAGFGQGIGSMFGTTLGKAGGDALGKTIGGTLGSLIPGIGSAIGSLVGPLLGKLFGGPSKAELEGRNVAKQFEQSFGGFDKMMAAVGKAYEATGRAAAQAQADVKAMFDAERNGGEATKAAVEKITKAIGEQKAALEQLPKSLAQISGGLNAIAADAQQFGATGQAAFDRVGRLAATAFAAATAGGKSFLDALAGIQPTLSTLAEAQSRFGFASSQTLTDLLKFSQFADTNKELVASIDGVNQMMQGLHTVGRLTQQDFDDLTATATESFRQMVAGGLDGGQALRAMQPTLQTIWEMHKKTGLALDENTQKILDQAEQQGIVGADMEDVNRQILDVLKSIRDVLAGAATQAGVLGQNIQRLPSSVPAPWKDWGPPPDFADLGVPAVPMASGGAGTVMRPTLFLAGEDGPEQFAFSGGGRRFASDAVDMSEVSVGIQDLASELRWQRATLPLMIKAALAGSGGRR